MEAVFTDVQAPPYGEPLMKTSKQYEVCARFRRLDGRDEDIYLADGPQGESWLIISNKYRHDPRSPDIILLERRRGPLGRPGASSSTDLSRRSILEQDVAAALERIGEDAFWQPDDALSGLPGRPDFWSARPTPLIISVRGCGAHAHDCELPDAQAATESMRYFRTAHDARGVEAWWRLGVPTIVVWGCAVAGMKALDRFKFDGCLSTAISRREPAQINFRGLERGHATVSGQSFRR
jgi:G:T-mismatch repair DNA endonuclease (very short patch repair protein)